MPRHRLTLPAALLLSLLAHVLLVGGSELALPDFYTSPDEVLERKQVTRVQRVQIATRPPEARKTAHSGIRLSNAGPSHKPKPLPAEKPEPPHAEPPPSEEAQAADNEVAADAPPPEAEQDQALPAPPPPDPAPAFPVQLTAQLDARVSGIPVIINQTWVMEGFRYFISQDAKKFGFRLSATSEGTISSEGGLRPERSQMRVNDQLKSFCEYSGGVIRYGKAGTPRQDPLPVTPQDMASLPIHIAVTFTGQPRTFFLCSGRKVYQVRVGMEAEEKIRLPVGTLRTLHIYGERFDKELGTMVRDVEVWLAPDYLNFPVKVVGHSSSGERFEYRVRSLEIEGKLVLGSKEDAEVAAPDEAIPDWLQQRVQTDSLNKP